MNFTPSQLSSLEGSYIFKAIINGTSESETTDEIRLDFTGPTVPSIELTDSTDAGSFNNDNVTKVVRPVIKLTSEKN